MKSVILAAGYATRLYPLTKDVPKPLLDVGGRTILDRLVDKIDDTGIIDEIIVVSNAKFFSRFEAWSGQRRFSGDISILNDGSTGNRNRLGAVADLRYAVKARNLREDTMVLAGDNLFDFSLSEFTNFFFDRKTDCITAHRLHDDEKLRRTGVVEVDDAWRVVSFEEKPLRPKSSLAVPPFYIYRGDTLPLLDAYLEEGRDPDAPGNFIPWLLQRKTVSAYFFQGRRFDIGNMDTYRAAQKIFANPLKNMRRKNGRKEGEPGTS